MIRPSSYGALQRPGRNFIRITEPHMHMPYDDFMSLLDHQERRCAICGVKTWLVIDHNHRTGLIRGLVCNPCNWLIGQVERNEVLDLRVCIYLLKSPTKQLNLKYQYIPYSREEEYEETNNH